MSVQEFLLKDELLNLSEVAKAMWPKNKTARIYLNKKLHGGRKWTVKDTQLAKTVLSNLAVDIQALD